MSTTAKTHMHLSYHVSDVSKTVDFYRVLFEREPAKLKPGYAKFELEDPALVISFTERPAEVRPDFGHLGFQVFTDQELNRRFEVVRDAGLGTLCEKQTACCYALQDKFWVADPDGYRWEVYRFLGDVDINSVPKTPDASASCC